MESRDAVETSLDGGLWASVAIGVGRDFFAWGSIWPFSVLLLGNLRFPTKKSVVAKKKGEPTVNVHPANPQ